MFKNSRFWKFLGTKSLTEFYDLQKKKRKLVVKLEIYDIYKFKDIYQYFVIPVLSENEN